MLKMEVLLFILVCFVTCSVGFKRKSIEVLSNSNPLDVVLEEIHKSNSINAVEISSIASSLRLDALDIKLLHKNLTSCSSSLFQLLTDLKNGNMYALKALDSWGKPESGLLQGNTKWPGRYRECLEAVNTTYGHEFNPEYCVSFLGSPMISPQPIFQVGTCWPDTCNATQINSFFYSIMPKSYYSYFVCNVLSFDDWEAKDLVAIVITVMLVSLVVAATILDLVNKKKLEIFYGKLDESNESQSLPSQPLAMSSRVLVCFSLVKNTKMLLDTKQKSGQIHCLHGIRFLSMAWVVLGHSQLFAFNYVDNISYIIKYSLNHWTHQMVANGTFSVDTFFFLSGLLVAYLGMREIEKREGRINPLLMYFLRFMRLTPAYAFCIFISVTLYMKLGEGAMFYFTADAFRKPCSSYWWTNLLYINNLYPSGLGEECYAWGWYLANDMQFYILSPIFLFFLYRRTKIGHVIILSFISLSIFFGGLFSSITKQQPMVLSFGTAVPQMGGGGSNSNFTVSQEKKYGNYVTDIYTKPYVRMGAYLVGFLVGYFLHKHRSSKIKLSKVFVLVGWMASTLIACLLIFGLYPTFKKRESLNNNVAAFYNALARPLWSVVMGWITIACVNGYGGPVNKFLSWKVFIPLSRLTYTSYLVHPLILVYTYTSVETMLHVDMYILVVYYIGQLVLTHMIAYIVAMLVEFPSSNLIKLLTSRFQNPPLPESPYAAVDSSEA